MADTFTYSGGKNTYFYYKGIKCRMDSFTVVADSPAEQIAPIGSSLGDAGSAGIVSYSGSFAARLLVKGKSTGGHTNILASSNAFLPTSAVFRQSSNVAYKGKILLTNKSVEAAGGAVVKFTGSWVGCDGFKYVTSS